MDWLPFMLQDLLDSPVYNGDRRPPADQVGIYLFSRNEEHLYVGRTGRTARARAGETKYITSFRTRFANHTQPSAPPGTAPFAHRLLREKVASEQLELPKDWWKKRHDDGDKFLLWFTEIKREISQMECRIVVFEDDDSGIRSTVAETYIHACLGTPHNSFLTS